MRWGLRVDELLALQRDAAGGAGGAQSVPGRPIGEWEPHALEVHPAGPGIGGLGKRLLPGYVKRAHDQVLVDAVRDAAAGRSQMLVLVGESSTGKTRACWEAVQPLAEAEPAWRLWHPFDPTRAEAALETMTRVGPRTVVWLNEAQHYFGDRAAGERIAAAVHHLLTSPERGPVLVLGTLWPDYARQYAALPSPGASDDPYSRVRELLAGRAVSVPETFDVRALAAAKKLAEGGDRLLGDALTRARADGRLTQELAGGPVLLERYKTASPAAKALLQAAMDARRLEVGLHLPQAFLTDAATDYLHDADWNLLTDDWAEMAYAELAKPVHGKQAPLSRVTPRPDRRGLGPPTTPRPPTPRPSTPVFRLADYLEQHGRSSRRHLCPPDSFWHASSTHLTRPDDLDSLTRAAQGMHRLQWAHHLRIRAADHGSIPALLLLGLMREETGDPEGAENLLRRAADRGNTTSVLHVALMRDDAGDREGAERLAQLAADNGDNHTVLTLIQLRAMNGDWEGAERLAQLAAGDAQWCLDAVREWTRDREDAERGTLRGMPFMASLVEADWEREVAEIRLDLGGDHDTPDTPHRPSERGGGDEDGDDVDPLDRLVAGRRDSDALRRLLEQREGAEDREGSERLARVAADSGNSDALCRLAELREQAENQESAERLARVAADYGDTRALFRLAELREQAGDRESAETLARTAVDHGGDNAFALKETEAVLTRLWPYGLDPDGTPTPRWQCPTAYQPITRWLTRSCRQAPKRTATPADGAPCAAHPPTGTFCATPSLCRGAGRRSAAPSPSRDRSPVTGSPAGPG
ncbi:tetratricopeptide repeat protein [Streptomyces chartreusis]|uniref:tetratricopeptide repeat protein n=1 Tax=Streptomyces chartreusis TaxID=1969 RepID=UPI0037B06593